MKIQHLYTSIVIVLTCTISICAQEVYKLDQVLVPSPKVRIGKLENGLTYYIRENKKPEKRAELRLVVKAGSVLEDDDQQGLAHFDEHMAFNGTKNFPKMDLVNYLEKSGVRFGPELNAYTSFDETVYMLQVPTDSPDVMKKGFQVLEDWAHNVTYDDVEIDKERGVILEEWRLRRGAEWRTAMKHIPFELYKSRYADRITIGKKEIIESCPHDALRRYYHDWYRPDLMAVLAIGDFDKDQIETIIKEHFSQLSNPQKERNRVTYPIPDHKQTLVSIVTDPELTRTSVEVVFKRAFHYSRMVSDYRNDIISNLYDGMLNDRLRELLQKPNPPFIYGYCGDGRFYGEKQAYYLGASIKGDSILSGLDAVLTEAYKVKKFGFTSTELERQKTEMLRMMEEFYRERDKTESRTIVSEYTRNFLYQEPIPGIEAELALYKQLLPGITLAEMNKLTNERMTSGNCVITVSEPQKANFKVPTKKEVLAVLIKAASQKLEPYIDKASNAPLLSKLPAPGSISEEKKIDSLDVTEWKLSNGARVVLKTTDFKNDEVLFSATSDGGSSLVADTNFMSALLATSIIDQSGIGAFDYITLQKKLSGKIVNVHPYIGPLSEGFNGSASPEDLETLFQLIYLYGTSPRKDSSAFISFMTRQKASLENRSASPEAAYNDTIQVTLANYHFRSRPMSVRLLNEINFDKALSIYKTRFEDFSDFIFFFIGNFQLEKIKPLVEQYLATLPSLNRNETWKDVGMNHPQGVINKEVDRGIEPKSTVNITFTGPFEWSQQNRYTFNAMIEVLNIKLREVLREDKGGTYGVRASGSQSLIPRQEYSITLSWGCKPERVDELVQIAFQQIDSLKLQQPDSLYLEKVKEIQRRGWEINVKQNGFWLNNLRFCYANNENPEMIMNYPKLVDGLTAQSIQTAVKKYFNMNNYVKVVLFPEKKN